MDEKPRQEEGPKEPEFEIRYVRAQHVKPIYSNLVGADTDFFGSITINFGYSDPTMVAVEDEEEETDDATVRVPVSVVAKIVVSREAAQMLVEAVQDALQEDDGDGEGR